MKKSLKLIDNIQAFSIECKISVRHALFLTYGMYLTYQTYMKIRDHEQEIRNELLDQKQQIHSQYQPLYNKFQEGSLDCTIDQGDWIFSNGNEKILEFYQKKQSLNYNYQLFMPLYVCAGIGWPLLTIGAAYMKEKDSRSMYLLATLTFLSGVKLIIK